MSKRKQLELPFRYSTYRILLILVVIIYLLIGLRVYLTINYTIFGIFFLFLICIEFRFCVLTPFIIWMNLCQFEKGKVNDWLERLDGPYELRLSGKGIHISIMFSFYLAFSLIYIDFSVLSLEFIPPFFSIIGYFFLITPIVYQIIQYGRSFDYERQAAYYYYHEHKTKEENVQSLTFYCPYCRVEKNRKGAKSKTLDSGQIVYYCPVCNNLGWDHKP
ncbi:MAG: hypothetical protein ACTSUV_06465 [Candidatus Ranarchaeia archaeon]